MLTFVMATRNEGPDFDLCLRALARARGPDDALLVFHTGDGQTLGRLEAFAEHHATRIIQTDTSVERPGDLLRLGLKMAETDYVLALAPTDRLHAEGIAGLRAHLGRDAPDLCLIHSAWWLADADHPLPRRDSAAFETLPQHPDAAALTGLLPDPRRLVFRTRDWAGRAPAWPAKLEGKALYAQALAERTELTCLGMPALLHLLQPVDPGPVLSACAEALAACPKGDRAACLADWAALLDEHLTLCPPAEAATLLAALPRIAALLPRAARRGMDSRPGPFARLLATQIREGDTGAKAELGLQLAAEQQRRTDILAAAYGRLRRDLDLALPGPDYLHALYARLRGLQ